MELGAAFGFIGGNFLPRGFIFIKGWLVSRFIFSTPKGDKFEAFIESVSVCEKTLACESLGLAPEN